MINEKNPEKAKILIRKARRPILVKAQNNTFNRALLEYGKFDTLIGLEFGDKKDGLKYLDSGLNSILARIAKKNKISIGIDLDKLRYLEKKEKGKVLARTKQNIKLCNKVGTKIKILNQKDKKDAFSLLISLGASTKQAEEAVN
jgi:RNase P/RNase MRP subunit p30